MVVKMMRWPPWPPLVSKKFQVKLVVLRLHGLRQENHPDGSLFTAEVRWKGPRSALRPLRKTIRRNCTKEAGIAAAIVNEQPLQQLEEQILEIDALGRVDWNEEFLSVCTLTSNSKDKDNIAFHPWEISFLVFNGPSHGPRNKVSIIGTALLNLAEFAPAAEKKETEIQVPLSLEGYSTETLSSLHLALSFLEMRTTQESSEIMQRTVGPILSSPHLRDALPAEKDEVSALKAGLRKVKILREFVSKSKKTRQEDDGSDGRFSVRSDDAEYTYPFDTDSMDDDLQKGELEDGKETSNIRKSFSYGTLASANFVGGSFYSEMRINGEYEDWVYYSHRRSDVGCSHTEEASTSVNEQSSLQTSKRSILPWKRRRLGFRSPKPKGEPLLKPYGEAGGDDIDYDRRQMSSSDESLGWHKMDEDTVANRSSISEFGDDNFVIGSWETREVTSRDGHMKLFSQVFFASIDQRSERAAGEGACTALVAVIANWFQANLEVMPIKSQFDSLIREGSLEWRNLCEDESYRERFPDKHFDLETVLQAKIRPLTVIPSKSFIGFFHPEEVADGNNNGFEFLGGAMSFDSIWDEISHAALENGPSDGSPQLYIVSWNDHFFILKVEPDAYYVIDTLGERLYEGCNEAYILKFDENTSIQRMPTEEKSASGEATESSGNHQVQQESVVKEDHSPEEEAHSNDDVEKKEIVCNGKESCKEYIKNFLAAIPIRELQVDMSKGLLSSTPIHHRLQIEFHYTGLSKEVVEVFLPQETEVVEQLPQPADPPTTPTAVA